MADLIVTFGRGHGTPPLLEANSVRTEIIEITGEPSDGSMVSTKEENVADLSAGADCWVHIAVAPEAGEPATDPGTSLLLKSGERWQLWITHGVKVSVLAAA